MLTCSRSSPNPIPLPQHRPLVRQRLEPVAAVVVAHPAVADRPLATRALLAALPEARWSACGVLHLGREASHEAQQKKAVERLGWPPDVLAFVDAATASQRLAWPVNASSAFPPIPWRCASL